MSGQSFFLNSAVPPKCPKCGHHFTPGDTVEVAPIEDGRNPETRQHVDCANPQGAVGSALDKLKKKIRGEQV